MHTMTMGAARTGRVTFRKARRAAATLAALFGVALMLAHPFAAHATTPESAPRSARPVAPKPAKGAKPASTPAANTPPTLAKANLDGLAFRSIGPAVTGGRVIDIEVNPRDHSEYFVGSGHGSLWKTTNAGVTFSPVFDGQSAFSIGAVTIAPSDPNIVWVGTGENNAQSYVVPGDGV